MSIRMRDGERGVTLALVVLCLFVFLGLCAIAVDAGILYTARTSAQHAADAAAIAGAFTFLNPTAVQPTAAQDAAIAVAASNRILGQPVVITADDVNVDTTRRLVTVTVRREGGGGVATIFARALGVSAVDVRTAATAQASETASGTRCIKPVFVPNTVLSSKSPSDACSSGEVIFDGSGQLTTWAQNEIAMDPCTLMRPTHPNDVEKQADIGAGQFFSLDFGAGADTYRCTWSKCLNDSTCNTDQDLVACWNSYPVETGDMVGPVNQGVDDMIGDDPDIWLGPFQYQRSDGTVWDTSRSVGTFPVWDNCNQPIKSGTAGQAAQVIGFLDSFVDGMSNQNGCTNPNQGGGGGGNWVKTHAIDGAACGLDDAGGEDTGGGTLATGPFARPVRLVSTE